MRLLLLTLLLATSLPAWAQNVLHRRQPTQAAGVGAPHRLTDGESAPDGEAWDGPAASVLPPNGFVEWDLGAARTLAGAALQGDNNDDYLLALSEDGTTWREAWRARAVDGGGLRTRSLSAPLGTARFVRLSATGGDTRYSVSELELFEGAMDDSTLLRARWVPRRPLELALTRWLLGLVALLFLASTRLPRALLLGLGVVGLMATAQLVLETAPGAPGASAALPWARAAVALLAIAALLRERLFRWRWPSSGPFVVGALGVSAALGLWCFLNLGLPQFHDGGAGRGTRLHHYDMRTYFPIAKYFPELRFDGVYAASLLAVAEGRPLEQLDDVALRDLRTHELTRVRDAKEHLLAVRARFSPERWAEFLSDMAYFRRAMGDGGFLGSMNDHGGNATPVWFLAARALFAGAPASDATLWRGVWADILLFALASASLWWAFGARTALLGVTVFGAMDFYQFGSNWFGATLRHDWLSLWAIGLSLLRKRKLELAGAAFAWSAWIRAFPALTLVTLSFPLLWAQLRAGSARAEARRAFLRIALGVAAASVTLVGLSVAVFGVDAWTEWFRKVQLLDRDNHLNNIAFRTYISVEKSHWRVALAGSLLLLAWTLRRASLARAAAWGVALIAIVFNPANYYLHSAFLLVALAGEQRAQRGATVGLRGTLAWLVLLAMCVASYFTNLGGSAAEHFQAETVILFVTLGLLWVLELGRPREAL